MMFKTHITISIFLLLLFLSKIEHKITFVVVLLIATLLPDIDTRFSKIGKKKIFRLLQFFVKHRGILHSFFLVFILTFIFALFFPIISLPFFLGYTSHLIADSFTIEGIYPLYPLKKRIFGKIKNGSKAEILILIIFVFMDIVLIVNKIFILS